MKENKAAHDSSLHLRKHVAFGLIKRAATSPILEAWHLIFGEHIGVSRPGHTAAANFILGLWACARNVQAKGST